MCWVDVQGHKVIEVQMYTYSAFRWYSYPLNYSTFCYYSLNSKLIKYIFISHPFTQSIHFRKCIENKIQKYLSYISIRTPESIPFITVVSHLGYVCISYAHLDLGIFSHSSFHHSSSVKLDGERRWTVIFKSFHIFSMGFNSGPWLTHSRNFTFLFWSHSSSYFAVWLGSLSCWN
jgi:hypothetical protein